jgi:hypothetical protein
MQQNKTLKFTYFNFIEKISEDENEDAMNDVESEINFKIAISDGAGAAGIYCKDWANFLVENQPVIPFKSKDNTLEWFLRISKQFYDNNYTKIDKKDPFILEKFNAEGSYATLFYLWFDKKSKKLNYSGIGDTTLFVFKNINKEYVPVLITPINEQKSLDDFPKLVNWNKSLNYDLTSKEIELMPEDIIILSTDSISRWLIYNLLIVSQLKTQELLGVELSNSINLDLLELLKLKARYSSLEDMLMKIEYTFKRGNEFFIEELKKLVANNELEKDDYTIIFRKI